MEIFLFVKFSNQIINKAKFGRRRSKIRSWRDLEININFVSSVSKNGFINHGFAVIKMITK